MESDCFAIKLYRRDECQHVHSYLLRNIGATKKNISEEVLYCL